MQKKCKNKLNNSKKKVIQQLFVKQKHKHILYQNNILDMQDLKCDCGLHLKWSIFRQRYEEQ